ncbi:class E sortase [Streptomyces bambusae]|uniref:class E sortase n=1 Tax=Streptomyces bambusae TaxID=1550616 RepID=UPI001CFE9B95|nr:class E sortase [Streptomyces bambusae]MCB5163759.1 class E sortase [Streptomyces bambusae]
MLRHRTVPAALATVAATAVAAALVGCSTGVDAARADARPAAVASPSMQPGTAPAAAPPRTPATVPAAKPTPTPTPTPTPAPGTSGRPTRTGVLSIPEIGLKSLRVVPYEGTTDDWPGTRIQDRGLAASPYGARGGAGPGQIGNYLVTAHRLSAGGPLRDLPSLDVGDPVYVTAGGTVYEYRITATRKTSFRSERSLAEQRAAVPGDPGARPTRAMITISTCATPEDNAAGNFWRDDRSNPEHRIDKIGVLVATRPASAA